MQNVFYPFRFNKFWRCGIGIIVGLADPPTMAAVLYFNTTAPSSPFIRHYQIPFSEDEEYIDHACYLDCAQLYEESAAWINRSMSDNREESLLGHLPDELLRRVLETVKNASTINRKIKRKYDLL